MSSLTPLQIGAIAVTIAVMGSITYVLLKKHRVKKLNRLLVTKQYNQFNQLLNSKGSAFFFSKVMQLDYRLKEAFLRNDTKKAYQLIDEILASRITIGYREQILMQGFNYALNNEHETQTTKYYDQIQQQAVNARLKEETAIMYDVYILKGDRFLDELLQRINETEPMYNAINELLVAKIYENKHDLEKSKQYYQQAKQHTKQLDHFIAHQQ